MTKNKHLQMRLVGSFFYYGILSGLCFFAKPALSQNPLLVQQYLLPEAKQGVAVDKNFFYVINNTSITKHTKENGKQVAKWYDTDSLLTHLNSGIIIHNRLYCCHSNYPTTPMASSVEIFDPITMRHTGSHSFGNEYGSATWMDFYKGHWYVAFAHYTGKGGEPGKDNSWSRIVQFDTAWRSTASWMYPTSLLEKFNTKSNSGGVILPDGSLLCTGHDEPEVYHLQLPKMGAAMMWLQTIPVGFEGQGFACETISGGQLLLYGIVRKEKKVVVSKIKMK